MISWRVRSDAIGTTTERWSVVDADGRPLPFRNVVVGWKENSAFRERWLESLRALALDAYAWECPPVTASSAARDFECVFVRSPALARMPPDPAAFAEHFRPDCNVVTFGNLGGDAMLVAPCPGGLRTDFSHLASFTATAPAAHQDALWRSVGEASNRRIGTKPVWISTAGLGVAWLHVRLDDRPKYYRHIPYTSMPV